MLRMARSRSGTGTTAMGSLNHKGLALAKYDRAYRKRRKAILASNPSCYLCGEPGADTIDHVVPLANGGTMTADNERPAHFRCNSGKRDRPRVGVGGWQSRY
jgi:5-methylcytosine-specific restriction endonuclease McrA